MANFKVSSVPANEIGLHIVRNPSLYEPARNNNFDLIINDVDRLLREGVDPAMATEEDYITGVGEIIRISAENFPVPNYSLEPVPVRRVNSTIKYAGGPTWSSGKFKCTDFVGARTKDALMALKAQAYDINHDVLHEASNYKHTWEVIEYNIDYTKKLRSWYLYGAWISDCQEGDFSHDDSGKRSIDVTVEFDRAIPVVETEEAE